MKKVLIVNGSKRKNGNSYALEKYFAEKLAGKAEVSTFRIGEKSVNACLACDACKRQHYGEGRRSKGGRRDGSMARGIISIK